MFVRVLLFLVNLAIARAQQNGASDPTSCQRETFLTALRTTSKGTFKTGANPCGTKCSGNNYCQCAWSVRSCLGNNRPDCPVTKTCKPCPKGYKCNNKDGSAIPTKANYVASVVDAAQQFMARLRGSHIAAAPPA